MTAFSSGPTSLSIYISGRITVASKFVLVTSDGTFDENRASRRRQDKGRLALRVFLILVMYLYVCIQSSQPILDLFLAHQRPGFDSISRPAHPRNTALFHLHLLKDVNSNKRFSWENGIYMATNFRKSFLMKLGLHSTQLVHCVPAPVAMLQSLVCIVLHTECSLFQIPLVFTHQSLVSLNALLSSPIGENVHHLSSLRKLVVSRYPSSRQLRSVLKDIHTKFLCRLTLLEREALTPPSTVMLFAIRAISNFKALKTYRNALPVLTKIIILCWDPHKKDPTRNHLNNYQTLQWSWQRCISSLWTTQRCIRGGSLGSRMISQSLALT